MDSKQANRIRSNGIAQGREDSRWMRERIAELEKQRDNSAELTEDILRAKNKRIAELEARDWQPIETAPRDGTYVLLWEAFLDNPFVGCWHSGRWVADLEHVEAEGGWNGAIVVSDVYTDDVTHWMPLPEPPE